MDANEVDEDEMKYIVVTAQQVTNLLETTEVTNSDYNTVKALAEGDINYVHGLSLRSHRARQLPTLNGYRRLPCYGKNALAPGRW